MVIVALFTVLASSPLSDATEAERAEARRLKDEAFAKIAEGSFGEGIDRLEAAYGAVPHPTFLFNIAVVYDQWSGHCEESLTAFDRFFAACDDCSALETAEVRFGRVKEKCEVVLSVETVPDGAGVEIDGELAGSTPFETTLRPGRHRVVLRKDGFRAREEKLALEPGRDRQLSVTLAPRVEEPDLSARAPAPPRRGGALRAGAWAASGLGAVGVGMGAVFTILALDSVDEEEELREREGIDPGEVRDARDEARSRATLAYVGYGIGVAGIGASILLHVLAGQKAREDRSLALGTDGRSLVLSGRF